MVSACPSICLIAVNVIFQQCLEGFSSTSLQNCLDSKMNLHFGGQRSRSLTSGLSHSRELLNMWHQHLFGVKTEQIPFCRSKVKVSVASCISHSHQHFSSEIPPYLHHRSSLDSCNHNVVILVEHNKAIRHRLIVVH